ncbi:MAG: purine/pyrimidine permease [Archaeoglobaceae archaeon]
MGSELRYELEDVPKLRDLIAISVQWLLVIAPILIIGGRIVAEMHYADAMEKTAYMQKVFFISGLTLIAQLLFGHRLPIVPGPPAVLIVGIYATLESGLGTIYSSIAVCGIILSAFALSGKINSLQKFFTENVITALLLLIAFSLIPLILEMLVSNKNAIFNVFFAIALVLALFGVGRKMRSVWDSMILLALVFGSLAYLAIFPQEFNTEMPRFEFMFFSPNFEFSLRFDVLIVFLLCYLALAVNDISSIYSTGRIIKAENMEKRVRKGVSITGLSSLLSGLLGVIGTVNYTLSPGIIHTTKSSSRLALIPTGLALITIAFIPSIIFVFSVIPKAVVASVFLLVLCSQIAIALTRVRIDDEESGFVIGFPILVSVVISFLPPEIFGDMPYAVKAFLGNSFLIGILLVIFLEHVIFKRASIQSQKR